MGVEMMIDGKRSMIIVNGRSNSAIGQECEGNQSEEKKENGDGTMNNDNDNNNNEMVI